MSSLSSEGPGSDPVIYLYNFYIYIFSLQIMHTPSCDIHLSYIILATDVSLGNYISKQPNWEN